MGSAGNQESPAPSLSAQRRQSLKLSTSPTQTLKLVSRPNFVISCPRIVDADMSLAEFGSWRGYCYEAGEICSKQKRALDDVNSLLDKILFR